MDDAERFDKGKMTTNEAMIYLYGEEKAEEMREEMLERIREKNKNRKKLSDIIKVIKEEPNVKFVTRSPYDVYVLEVVLYHSIDLDIDRINDKLKQLDVEVWAKPGRMDKDLNTHFIIPLLIREI